MKYMGSKNRHAKYIVPHLTQHNKIIVLPFVGGANIADKLAGYTVIANDINHYLITMYKAVQRGWMPRDNYTEEQYNYFKQYKPLHNPLTGYMGFALSYGGKFFGGWCRDSEGKRNYAQEAYRNAVEQFPKLKNMHFYNRDYRHIPYPEDCVIYCDPPYTGTTKYSSSFNSEEFYKWAEHMAKTRTVYISEYDAPFDNVVWDKEVASSLTKNRGAKRAVEKLYKV